MAEPRVVIEVTPAGWGSRILIDGQEVPNVKAFTLHADLEGSSLTVTFSKQDVRVIGNVDQFLEELEPARDA